MPEFICWAPHHEDLTDKVKAAISEKPHPVFGLMTIGWDPDGERGDDAEQVSVKCSEGHQNIFCVYVEGRGS